MTPRHGGSQTSRSRHGAVTARRRRRRRQRRRHRHQLTGPLMPHHATATPARQTWRRRDAAAAAKCTASRPRSTSVGVASVRRTVVAVSGALTTAAQRHHGPSGPPTTVTLTGSDASPPRDPGPPARPPLRLRRSAVERGKCAEVCRAGLLSPASARRCDRINAAK